MSFLLGGVVKKKMSDRDAAPPGRSRNRAVNERHVSAKPNVSVRKSEHIQICLREDVRFEKTNGFEKYDLIHYALPEIDLSEIDTTCFLLGKRFDAPIFIEAMTGGAVESLKINENISGAAERHRIGMGLGSQRAMILNPAIGDTYRVRHTAPNIFLAGNIGASQLKEFSVAQIKQAVEIIEADAIAVHLNAAQELCQPEGDTGWSKILIAIEKLCRNVDYPVIVKETGCGLNGAVAKRLENAGVACIDTGGAGGTSWAKVERFRGSRKAVLFLEWGIPTAESLYECVHAVKIPVIASGGIRNGIEIVKALAMGAKLAGMAMPFLKPACTSMESVQDKISALKKEITNTMFLIGAKRIADINASKLRRIPS
jgi:isopentenyl-diphosphate Delta-isomerase